MKLVCIYFIGLGLVNIEFLFDSEAEELNNGVMLIGVLMEFNFQTLFFFFWRKRSFRTLQLIKLITHELIKKLQY